MTDELLGKITDSLMAMDPVSWMEKNLTLDGKPYRINGNGYKPLADIARTIGIKALEKSGKPIVICKGRQIGLTVLNSGIEMFFMGSGLFGNGHNPPIRVIHAFPQLELANAFSKVKLNAMINNSIPVVDAKNPKKSKSLMNTLLDQTSDSNNSLNFKQFQGGNHMFIESIGLDGNRTMGKSSDIMVFDEIQKMTALGVGNSLKVLTKAAYGPVGDGIQVYYGTPLQRGSMFSDMWEKSNKQFYHLGCSKCKEYFPLFTQDSNEWEDIWLYGHTVRCTHCGCEQDKRDAVERGKWIALNGKDDMPFIGFHLNQLYMPEFTKEKIIAEKPGNSAINTERTYQNEVLGNFWSGESGVMSFDEIREICGDSGKKYRSQIDPQTNEMVFLGIDIGEKNDLEQMVDSRKPSVVKGMSYSVAVVITVSPTGRIQIERADKFKRNDFESKKETINYFMRKYSVNLAVMDLGYTGDLSQVMQTEHGERFLCSQASNKVNNHIKFNSDVFPKVITFERDYWIAEFYDQMRKGNVRFPLGDYEKVAWLMQHCANMEIKPSKSSSGDFSPHYIKAGANDGFMALLNAYIAYKFSISGGFTIQNPLMMHNSPKRKPPIVVGYIPGL